MKQQNIAMHIRNGMRKRQRTHTHTVRWYSVFDKSSRTHTRIKFIPWRLSNIKRTRDRLGHYRIVSMHTHTLAKVYMLGMRHIVSHSIIIINEFPLARIYGHKSFNLW